MTLHLSRIRLDDAPDTAALAGLLLPSDEDMRIAAAHRLLWSLFADEADRRRDFLWRENSGSSWQRTTFLVLSARPPEDRKGLFLVETKRFDPVLAAGQRLAFRLRASPGATEAKPYGERGKRIDLLARALRGLDNAARTAQRDAIRQEVGATWLARQGKRAGFHLAQGERGPSLRVEGDAWRVLPREGSAPVRFSALDFEGELVIEDPAAFLAALANGFGRAKAFGCGLMLIRRA